MRKLRTWCGDFDWTWKINFTESCWFDESALGNDAKDWNYKLCGVTHATSKNNRNSVLCAARPNLQHRGLFEVTWYTNDEHDNFKWGEPGLIVDTVKPTFVRMKKDGDKISMRIWSDREKNMRIEKAFPFEFNIYREVGPSFGGNRKAPWDIIIWVDKNNKDEAIMVKPVD